MQVVSEFTDASCAPVEKPVEGSFDLFACSVEANSDAVAVCTNYDVCLFHKVESVKGECMSVKGLISCRLDFAPVIFFLLVEPSLKFRGKLVALDGCGEVVVDDGVCLHDVTIPQACESATDFFAFLKNFFSHVGTLLECGSA